MPRMPSGFASLREVVSYLIGTGVLVYGVVMAEQDRQLVIIGAGLALLGSPMVGGLFDRKVDR